MNTKAILMIEVTNNASLANLLALLSPRQIARVAAKIEQGQTKTQVFVVNANALDADTVNQTGFEFDPSYKPVARYGRALGVEIIEPPKSLTRDLQKANQLEAFEKALTRSLPQDDNEAHNVVLSIAGAEDEEFTPLLRQRGQTQLQALQLQDGATPRCPLLVINHQSGDTEIVAASEHTLRRTTAQTATSRSTSWEDVYKAPEGSAISMTAATNESGYLSVTATNMSGTPIAQVVDAFGTPQRQDDYQPYRAAGQVLRDDQGSFYAVEQKAGGRKTSLQLYIAANELAKMQAQQGNAFSHQS